MDTGIIITAGVLAVGTLLTLPFFMLITTLVMSAVTRRPLGSIDETVFRTPLFWVFFVPTTIAFWFVLLNMED